MLHLRHQLGFCPNRAAVGVLAAVLGAGCAAEPRSPGTGLSREIDAAPAPVISPTVDSPLSTPLDVIAIRGSAPDAVRVLLRVEGEPGASIARVTSGSFCGEIKIGNAGSTEVEVISMTHDGRMSEPTLITVRFDASSAPPTECPGGVTEPNPVEDCFDGVDTDKDGVGDDCEQVCNSCVDDQFEPNDVPLAVPTITKGLLTLTRCPCQEDWFSFALSAGEEVTVGLTQDSASGLNLNLQLYRADDAESGNPVAQANSGTASETLRYCGARADAYYLRVYNFADIKQSQGNYRLNVRSIVREQCQIGTN